MGPSFKDFLIQRQGRSVSGEAFWEIHDATTPFTISREKSQVFHQI
jgi:hypothetical protein